MKPDLKIYVAGHRGMVVASTVLRGRGGGNGALLPDVW